MDTPPPIVADAETRVEGNDPLLDELEGEEALPADARDAVARRFDEWRPSYRLTNERDAWAFLRMVVASVLLDRLHAAREALRREEAKCAAESWDDDRRAEADDLARGLSRRPEVIARQLERTRQGAEWLIDQWRILGGHLERGKAWTETHERWAHDLLGTPRALRDALPLPEPAERLALVAREVGRLEARKARGLDAQDERRRRAAESGEPLTPSKAMLALERRESACERRYQKAADQLRALRLAAPAPEKAKARASDPRPEAVAPAAPAPPGPGPSCAASPAIQTPAAPPQASLGSGPERRTYRSFDSLARAYRSATTTPPAAPPARPGPR